MSAKHYDRHYFPGTDCVECLRERETVLLAAHHEDAQRIATIADEAFGPFPVQTCDENLSAIERGIFGLRQRIGRLEAERKAVADVASEGDVEDLLDALDNLAADPKDGETWGMRYQTASALHDAWQDERQRRGQAEQDAERWHRLFDEGATAIHAMQERLVAACERMGKAEADHARLVEAARNLTIALDGERDIQAALGLHRIDCDPCGEMEGNACSAGNDLLSLLRRARKVADEARAALRAALGGGQ